jgi:hypothetical protein
MYESSIDHVAQPTADQAVIGQRNGESPIQKYDPEVHYESRAKADDNGGKKRVNPHSLPQCWLPRPDKLSYRLAANDAREKQGPCTPGPFNGRSSRMRILFMEPELNFRGVVLKARRVHDASRDVIPLAGSIPKLLPFEDENELALGDNANILRFVMMRLDRRTRWVRCE